MATLYSLEICGIRNFSPDEKQFVYFATPVVLFQGPNGSGKTTILESIRYALTGELPSGVSCGQGFLNEPKMSNKSTTKANIKIKFYDAKRNMITISRVLQVQAKSDGGLQFKRLNYSIRKRDKADPNNIQDISGRCVDIDSYCCTALNVSKSIFNNVLFCHQENSLWPLDEPKKLKEKFDEIFDAVRYNTCVNTIRTYIKEKKNYVNGSLTERLAHKKYIKIQVERDRAKLEEKKNKLEEVKEAIKIRNEEMTPLENRMKEILDLEESLGKLQRKLAGREEEKKGLVNQQETIRKDISYIFEDSDDELQARINSFKDQQFSEKTSIRELESNIEEVTKQIGSINRNIQSKQVQIGQLKQEQTQHKKRLEESMQLIENLRSELEVEDIKDKNILLEELSKALNNQQKTFVELKVEKDKEENKLQEEIDNIRVQNAKIKQSITSKNVTIKDCSVKLRDIQCKLQGLDTSDDELKRINEKIEKDQSTLNKLKSSFNENEKKKEIEHLKEFIENKEQYLEKLDRENKVLQRNYITEQKIDSERSSILEKQGKINKIKTKHSQNLSTIFKDNVPQTELRKSVLIIQNKQEEELKRVTNVINNLEKEITTLETTLSHLEKTLKNDQQELSLDKKKIFELCKGKNFSTVLEEVYQKKERYQKQKGHLAAAEIMYGAFISKFEQNECCPLCKTDFKENTFALPMIINSLKSKITNIPSNLAETEANLKKEEKLYNELQQLKTINDDIETMTNNKIPKLVAEIGKLKEQFEEKKIELAAEKVNRETPQKLIEICKNLITDVTLLDQYQADITKSREEIEELQENIESVPSNRSRQETEMEIDSVKSELSNKRNRYESNKSMLDRHREHCQELNNKIQNEVQKKIDIQKRVQERPLLEKQNVECNDTIETLTTEIEELEMNLSAQEIDLKNAIDNKNSFTRSYRVMQEKSQKAIIANQNAISDIHKLERSIQDYQRTNGSERLETAVEELAQLNIKLQNLEKSKTETLSSIAQKRESIAKKESEFRALKDNVTLREKQKQEQLVAAEISKIKEKIGGYNYRQVYEEKELKNAEIQKKRNEINNLGGQLNEIEQLVKEKELDLNRPENKNAFNNYKKQYYELTVNQLAIKDLTKYAAILERSVLRFHEERMVHINSSIRNLWRTIYRGNDIDYIEIKTDEDTGADSKKRRIFSYKVVQVKNGIELDMRGRCSAGQKVLACLVIRMALAETFSSHCGILALDEPTTNLDKANISSLSDALSGLINSRIDETNFQLLVITHDEEFLRSITQVQSIDSYWQVKRSAAGNSVVERQML